jgi:hypothetical protein
VTALQVDTQLSHPKSGAPPQGHEARETNLGQDQDDAEGNVHNIGLLQEARGQNHSYGI